MKRLKHKIYVMSHRSRVQRRRRRPDGRITLDQVVHGKVCEVSLVARLIYDVFFITVSVGVPLTVAVVVANRPVRHFTQDREIICVQHVHLNIRLLLNAF